jgi:hypothetical protein
LNGIYLPIQLTDGPLLVEVALLLIGLFCQKLVLTL